ncbi:type II toxin-antitoxin system HicA family toxin [Subtercola endophyticus]|uniref:type II toxin-antitoxin system HicA family toxin n=1 Tax=Subtercola endophyticus TaxID=2895559 RepID=UPI0036F2495A
MLKQAGWHPSEQFVGSHRKWRSPDGLRSVSEGHRMISPGVFRQVMKAIEETAVDDV